MKKILSIITSCIITLIITCLFISCNKGGKTGSLTWVIKKGTLIISGQGAMPNYSETYDNGTPWSKLDIDSSINYIIIKDGITNIGDNAFYNCRNVVSVSSPDSILNIGKNAFRNCISLNSITIPNSVINIGESAFKYCNNLFQIELSNNIINIEKSAFEDCSKLIQIDIPDSVINIGETAFKNCKGLLNVTFGENLHLIAPEAFWGCINIQTITSKNPIPPILTFYKVGTREWDKSRKDNGYLVIVFNNEIFKNSRLIVKDEYLSAYMKDTRWIYFFEDREKIDKIRREENPSWVEWQDNKRPGSRLSESSWSSTEDGRPSPWD